jgi:hypothetical protein
MLEFQRQTHPQGTTSSAPAIPPAQPLRRTVSTSSVGHATKKQKAGMAKFAQLGVKRTTPLTSSLSLDETQLPSSQGTLTQAQIDDADHRIVLEELENYEKAGIIHREDPEYESLDLVNYWEVSRFEYLYDSSLIVPTSFRITARNFRFCSRSLLMFYLLRLQRCLVSGYSHPARRPIRNVDNVLTRACLRSFKFSSTFTVMIVCLLLMVWLRP